MDMLTDYALVLVFLVVSIAFIAITLFVSRLIAPQKPNPLKNMPYECGEPPVGTGWINYNMRFYTIALVFVVFDVEIAFIFPVAVLYREAVLSGTGLLIFIELLIFTGILFFGLIYVWVKGDLEWVRDYIKGGRSPIMSFQKPLEPQASEEIKL